MIKGMYQQYKRLGYTRIWELAHMILYLDYDILYGKNINGEGGLNELWGKMIRLGRILVVEVRILFPWQYTCWHHIPQLVLVGKQLLLRI